MTTHVLKWMKYSINLLLIFGYGVGLGLGYFTFNNISVISWPSVVLVEETIDSPQTLSHNVASGDRHVFPG
jgi:hypothetical protein